MHVPEIHEQRKKISGLKMPRRYSPRLPGASTKGQAPINPYGANKMKVASLSDVRRSQLERHAALKTASLTEDLAFYEAQREYEQFVKTASVREYGIFLELQKVAESVESPDEFWDYCIIHYGDEIEKDAGINAAIAAAGKLLTGAGRYFKSTSLTGAGSKMYGRLNQRLGSQIQSTATKSTAGGGKIDINAVKNLSKQRDAARAAQQAADKQSKALERLKRMQEKGLTPGKGKAPPVQKTPATPYNKGGGSDAAIAAAAAEAPAKGMSFGTKAKIVGGVGLTGGLIGTGMLTNRLNQIGKQENMMQSQRGFNYGMR